MQFNYCKVKSYSRIRKVVMFSMFQSSYCNNFHFADPWCFSPLKSLRSDREFSRNQSIIIISCGEHCGCHCSSLRLWLTFHLAMFSCASRLDFRSLFYTDLLEMNSQFVLHPWVISLICMNSGDIFQHFQSTFKFLCLVMFPLPY